jgi:hypothetical protein
VLGPSLARRNLSASADLRSMALILVSSVISVAVAVFLSIFPSKSLTP